MLRRILLIIIISQFFQVNGLIAQGKAGQAGEFLRWGVGAKAMGFGRAFTAVSDDASAMYWNPAGLAAFSRIGGSMMFMHMPLQEGASFNYLGGAVPLSLFFIKSNGTNPLINFIQDFNIGVGMLWHALGDFDLYNADASRAVDQSQNSITQSAFYFSVSYPLNGLINRIPENGLLGWLNHLKGDLNIGLTTKFVNQQLFGSGGTATSFDLGLKYTHFSGIFNLGLSLRDFNQSTISYDANIIGDRLPATGVFGVSLKPPYGRLRGLLLSFDYGIIKPSARDRDLMFGLEYDLSLISAQIPLKLRMGTNSNYESFTFGINFSPELLLGQDWLPYGDLTYANDKSAFDAAGARISISLDHNPFSAKYWYLKGMNQFTEIACQNLFSINANEKIIRHLKNAGKAKNPGRHAYRYEAALRQADFEFLLALNEAISSDKTDLKYLQKSINRFKKVQSMYTTVASKFLFEDFGKPEFDVDEYFKSFVYYVQCLILSGNEKQAVTVCADSGRSWGKKINVIRDRDGKANNKRLIFVNYLYAFALYKSQYNAEARSIINYQSAFSSLAKYLAGHFAFLESNFQAVLENLNEINLNDSFFPQDIFLPLTGDCTFGDEILFLKAASMYKISKSSDADAYIAEFAKIPRFFPNSDLAKFLTNGEALIFKMIDYYESKDTDNLDKLVNSLIYSYVESFSIGRLKEESYTFNYK